MHSRLACFMVSHSSFSLCIRRAYVHKLKLFSAVSRPVVTGCNTAASGVE